MSELLNIIDRKEWRKWKKWLTSHFHDRKEVFEKSSGVKERKKPHQKNIF